MFSLSDFTLNSLCGIASFFHVCTSRRVTEHASNSSSLSGPLFQPPGEKLTSLPQFQCQYPKQSTKKKTLNPSPVAETQSSLMQHGCLVITMEKEY